MSYILKRNEDGKYVAPAGSANSYTKDIRKARLFPTRESAEAGACGNERAIPVESELGRR